MKMANTTPAEEQALMDSPKYAAFHVFSTAYKVVDGHAIKAFTLIPKGLEEGSRPVVVKWHGGFFVLGTALYPDVS